MSFSNFHYNKNLKKFARENRSQPTKAENKLWHDALQNRQMLGYRFLRQRPIDKYIADFFSKELKLVIEVDGWSHHFEEVIRKDELKEQRLKALGYCVLRFGDEEVMKDFENVIRTIENWILDFEEKFPEVEGWKKIRKWPHPLSPPQGGGTLV
jgi:very-short-patch-repair endonuclease